MWPKPLFVPLAKLGFPNKVYWEEFEFCGTVHFHEYDHVRCFVVRVGREGAKEQQDIILYGTYIKEEHCLFENEDGKDCLLINISSDRLKWRPMPDINVGI